MNTLQVVNIALSMICVVITTALAWVAIYRRNKTEVSFTGTPVDKKEFERHQRENKDEHERFLSRIDAVHFRINPIEGQICALREASETNTARLIQMDGKIDRLMERTKKEA
jgi:hypothetical protein